MIQVEADNHGWSQGGLQKECQAEGLVLMVVLRAPVSSRSGFQEWNRSLPWTLWAAQDK